MMEATMGFGDAIRSCFAKYATFTGRAPRSEYWYFLLFQALLGVVAAVVSMAIDSNVLSILVDLALFLPSLAVGVRRLHDIDKSGWWLLLGFIPVIGWVMLFIWACTKGSLGPNRFGPDPLPASFGALA
jgi:uncharacterized membrane protein YhaH (DUF805 family)